MPRNKNMFLLGLTIEEVSDLFDLTFNATWNKFVGRTRLTLDEILILRDNAKCEFSLDILLSDILRNKEDVKKWQKKV